MVCLFCDSSTHFSHNCNVYSEVSSRKTKAASKNCCTECLTPRNEECDEKCEAVFRCFICFDDDHHVVFCPEQKSSSVILPNLEHGMFNRLLTFLDPIDVYHLALISPKIFNLADLKPLKIISSAAFKHNSSSEYLPENVKIVFTKKLEIDFTRGLKTFGNLEAEDLSFKLKTLILTNCDVSSQDFFRMISSKLEELMCEDVKFSEPINLESVLKIAGNLRKFQMKESNFEVDRNWPKMLLNCCKIEGVEEIALQIDNMEFKVDDLAEFMKAITNPNFHLTIRIVNPLLFSRTTEEYIQLTTTLMSKHFYFSPDPLSNLPFVKFVIARTYTNFFKYWDDVGFFTLL